MRRCQLPNCETFHKAYLRLDDVLWALWGCGGVVAKTAFITSSNFPVGSLIGFELVTFFACGFLESTIPPYQPCEYFPIV